GTGIVGVGRGELRLDPPSRERVKLFALCPGAAVLEVEARAVGQARVADATPTSVERASFEGPCGELGDRRSGVFPVRLEVEGLRGSQVDQVAELGVSRRELGDAAVGFALDLDLVRGEE